MTPADIAFYQAAAELRAQVAQLAVTR